MEEKIIGEKEVNSLIKDISRKFVKKNRALLKEAIIIGLRTHGVHLANRIAKEVKKLTKINVPTGILDITFYRDDISKSAGRVLAKETIIPCDLTDKFILLVDDVLFTGRSIRAALDELMDFGRPKKVELAVLIDRGHRELPIQPDYVGKHVQTSLSERIKVRLKEIDGEDCVVKTAET